MGNPSERQPGHNPQQRYKPVEFQPYQGAKSNFPTLDTFTVFSSFDETGYLLHIKASRPKGAVGEVRRAIIGTVDTWKEGRPTAHKEAAKILVQDFLSSGTRHVEWTPILDTLRGERGELGEVNELTACTFDLRKETDWKMIVKDAQDLTGADTALQDWLEARFHTWVDYLEAREREGSINTLANKVLEIYFDAVDWQSVTKKFKG